MNKMKQGELAEIYNKLTKMGAKTIMLKMLIDDISLENSQLEKQVAESRACLRAIKKINNGKNEGISALCEDDSKDSERKWG